jgi:integrase
MAAYQGAFDGAAPIEIAADRTAPGTIGALVVSYFRSTEWNDALSAASRRVRKGVIERFREKHGDKRVAMLQPEHVEQMMAAISNLYGRRTWLFAIKGLLQFAVPSMIRKNPAAGLKVKLPKSSGHHTWTDEEIAQFRQYWKLGTQPRLVMEFALEAISRRAEVVRIGPQHVRDGHIRIDRLKGSRAVDILLTPELEAACNAMPKRHAIFALNSYGKPWSVEGLGKAFGKWAQEAGLPDQCRLHGLKKGGMRRLAESGLTTHEIMGVSGHVTLSEVQRYTADADRKKLAEAGMKKRIGNRRVATREPSSGNPHRKDRIK